MQQSKPKAEVAQEIARTLGAVAKRADDADMPFLAYLIRMAEAEAKVTGSPTTPG